MPPTEADFFDSGEALLEVFSEHEYDLVLMDIYMKGMTGIETVSKIREVDPDVPVAFITTSTDFALESYRLDAQGYIEKPYDEKKIVRMLDIAAKMRTALPSLSIKKENETLKLPQRDIQYLEQHQHKVKIILCDGRDVTIYGKISELMEQLEGEPFCNCHKSYCVNLAYVRSIDTGIRCFVMKDGENIPIRRESMTEVKNLYENYLLNAARSSLNEQ